LKRGKEAVLVPATMLKGTRITDILFPGFVEKDSFPKKFHTLHSVLYLEFGKVMLKLSVLGYTGRLRIEVAERIEVDEELDDSFTPAFSSFSQLILRDPDGKIGFLLSTCLGDQTLCHISRSQQFDLANGQQIFIDPTYHFGIRIGGSEHEAIWKKNWFVEQQNVEIIVC
jgi:hypothetical protein